MTSSSIINLPFETPSEDIAFHTHRNAYPIHHKHNDFWEFIFISDGEVIHKINGESRKLKKNTLCILRPDDWHAFLQPNDTTSAQFNLAIKTAPVKELFSVLRCDLYKKLSAQSILEFEISSSNAESIARAADCIISADRANKTPAMILFLYAIIQEVLSHMVGTNNVRRQYSDCTNQFIRLVNNPSNLSLGLSQIASMTGYSYSHLNRTFLKETDMTPSQYLKKKRLKYAQELIENTEFPLSMITEKVGYSNYSHFSDFFKSATGVTPVEWSRKNRRSH